MDKKAAMSEQTKRKLKETFLELYARDGMMNVTVGAITKKAGYNRSTFYNYYDDLRDMLDDIENQVIMQVQTKITTILSNGIPQDISAVFPLILSGFEEYGNTLYILLGKNGDAAFRQRLRNTAKDFLREILKNRISEEQLEYILTFMVSAGLGLIEHWYETEKKYSSEEFLKLAQSLLASGVSGQLSK